MKKSYFKQMLAAILLLCGNVVNAHDFEAGGIYYKFLSATDNTVEVTFEGDSFFSYDEYAGVVTIPSTVINNGTTYNVVSIGATAFSGCTSLTEVTLPASLTTVGDAAFYGCSALTVVNSYATTAPALGNNAFSSISSQAVLKYLEGDYSAWTASFAECTFMPKYYYRTDGLPGVVVDNNHVWESPLINVGAGNSGVRITVFATNAPDSFNNYPLVALGELEFYDADGNKINYTADGVTTNSLESSEGSIEALCDGDYSTFYHSKWRNGSLSPTDYVYIDVQLPQDVTSVSVKIVGRNTQRLVPTFIGVTECGVYCARPIVTSGKCGDNATWSFADGTLTISGTGAMYDEVVIGDYLSEEYNTIVVEEGITHIGAGAFKGNASLTRVELPETLLSIGYDAFYNSDNLASIELPASLTSIGYTAFANCDNLTQIIIPEGVTNLGAYAFEYCYNLTNVVIGKSVASIGNCPFRYCNNLSSIVVDAENPYYDSRDNCNAIIRTETNTLIQGCKATTIPASVTTLGRAAFEGARELRSIEVPEGVTSFDYAVFWGCTALESIKLPSTLVNLGESTFHNCWSLTTVTSLATTAPAIYENTFSGISSEAVLYHCGGDYSAWSRYFASSITNAGSCGDEVTWALRDSTLTISGTGAMYDYDNSASVPWNGFRDEFERVVIEDGVTSICSYAFVNCNRLISVIVPPSVTYIGNFVANPGTSFDVHITDLSAWCKIDHASMDPSLLKNHSNLYLNNELITDLVIPEDISELKLCAFEGANIKSVTFHDNITTIGAFAFNICTNLETVNIPASVTTIENNAFSGCTNLTNITIPESVTSIGNCAFEGCSGLTSIEIPNSVTSIGNCAFEGCSGLTSIEIPNSVTSISERAFDSCSGLTSIVVKEGNTVYDSRNNCNAVIETATNTLVVGCKNTIIPDGITSIGYDAFSRCSGLTSIEIPNSVTSIGNSAFSDCYRLTSIEIPNSVTSIGNSAFSDCDSLTSVTIPSSVTAIGALAFEGCDSLTSVTSLIPAENLFAINSNAFLDVDKEACTLYVPYAAKATYAATEGWSEFTNIVEIPYGKCGDNATWELADSTLTINGTGAMYDYTGNDTPWNEYRFSEIKNVVINEGITRIGSSAFRGFEVAESVLLPEGITSIGNRAFSGNALREITMPNSLTIIEDYAFYLCTNLESITIPGNVTSIGQQAFNGCTGLTSITSLIPADNLFAIDSSVFENVNKSTCTLNVPYGAQETYATTDGWSEFANISLGKCGDNATWNINEGVLTIKGSGAMYDYSYPGDSYHFGADSTLYTPWFNYRDEITSVIVEEGITTLGCNAFSYCTKLASVSIPEGITAIEEYAFFECDSVTSVTIPESVTRIGLRAFDETNLTSIAIPAAVEAIDESAFGSCRNLASIVVSENNSVYDSRGNCNAIIETATNTLISGCMNTVIPNDIEAIARWAFMRSESLKSIVIPETVRLIDSFAFEGCDSLTSVKSYIPAENLFAIDSYAFLEVDKEACTLYVPVGAKETYAATRGWSEFTNIVEIPYGKCGDNATWELADGVLTISGTGDMYDYDSDGPWYDYHLEITSVVIEVGITSIGNNAFNFCFGLTSIEIPNSVTSIGNYAFSQCHGLTSIEIPNSVTSVGDWAFSSCSGLTSIEIPNSVTSIGGSAFYACSGLTSIEIPNSVTSIGEDAFYACSGLTSIEIPNSVTSIGEDAFYACSGLTSIVVKEGNTVYDSRNNCNAVIETATNTLVVGCKNTIIPYGITSIGRSAFSYCDGLTSIEIPNSVTSIGGSAFSGCSGLTSIVIPNRVTSIGDWAFSHCSSITSLIPAEYLFATNSYVFENVDKSTCTLYVPAGAKETYAATEGWSEFTNIVEIVPDAFELTVGSAGYATLYLSYDVERPKGVKAYYISSVQGDYATLEPVWDYIPAKTGVILQAKPGTYSFEYTTDEVEPLTDNLLCGTPIDREIPVAANTEYYALGRADGIVGLYRATTPGGIYFNNANKAYLPLTVAEQSARVSLLFPDGTTTDVNEVFGAEGEDVIYDIYGNRIEEITEHGVYIINGKKVIR